MGARKMKSLFNQSTLTIRNMLSKCVRDTPMLSMEMMFTKWQRVYGRQLELNYGCKRFIYSFLSIPLPPPESAGVQPTPFGLAILQPRMHSMRINRQRPDALNTLGRCVQDFLRQHTLGIVAAYSSNHHDSLHPNKTAIDSWCFSSPPQSWTPCCPPRSTC